MPGDARAGRPRRAGAAGLRSAARQARSGVVARPGPAGRRPSPARLHPTPGGAGQRPGRLVRRAERTRLRLARLVSQRDLGGGRAVRLSRRPRFGRAAALLGRGQHPGRGGRVRPGPRVAAQQRLDRRAQRPGPPGPGRVLVRDRGQDGQRGVPVVERAVPFHRRVQGGAQRPQVGRRAGRLAADPFRRGEPGGAHHHPGLGEPGVALQGGDAEVGQHGPAVRAEQHVARLDVTMQDAGRVRAAQRAEQPAAQIRGLLRGQRAVLGHDLLQRAALDQLHHDPRAAVGLLDHVEDGDHRGVVQPGRGARLAQRALVQNPGLLGDRAVAR